MLRETGLCVVLCCSTALAGDLTPPPGPVAPSMLTLDEVEPRTVVNESNTPGDAGSVFRITSPGSYVLIGDVLVDGKPAGVVIDASDVTLDLNGFSVVGSPDASIGIGGAGSGVTVRDGVVRSFEAGSGIELSGDGLIVERVRVRAVQGRGIVSTGGGAVIDCRVRDAEGTGIDIRGGVVRGCVVNNGGIGIRANGSTLRDCVADGCLQDGVIADASCAVEGCVVTSCANGFFASGGSVLRGCVATGNQRSGFTASSGTTLESCRADGSQGGGYTLVDSRAIDCSATGNGGDGYECEGSELRACSALNNELDGYLLGEGSTLVGCSAEGNVFAGLLVVGNGCTVDGCTVTGSDTGIDAGTTGGVYTRNVARGNTTNYLIGPGNTSGTIRTTPVGAGPWENFEY